MLVRNRLKAGDFIVPIPLGIPVELQYDSSGILKDVKLWSPENAKEGYQFDNIKIKDDIVCGIRCRELVPITIPLTGGTTFVYGVMVFSNHSTLPGYLPSAILPDMIRRFSNGEDCKLYVFNVHSYAANFRGANPIRKWLSIARFNQLPGFLAPFNDARKIDNLIKQQDSRINMDIIMAYATFNGNSYYLVSTELQQVNVTSCVFTEPNMHGAIMSKFNATSGEMQIPYSEVVRFNIHKGTHLILEDSVIVFSYESPEVRHEKRPSRISCNVCGKVINVRNGVTKCPDVHCMSRMYDAVTHMLSTLKLPEMLYTRYTNLVSDKKIICIADILDLEEYSSLKSEVSLTTVLESVMLPVHVPDRKSIWQLVSQCKNSIESVMYYANHPDNILSDLNLGNVNSSGLVAWFKDIENVSELHAILSSGAIKIVDTDKYYQAAPIFRNTTICVTGEFNSGNLADIRGILGSYGAEVVTQVVPETRYLVVGDKKTNVDSRLISSAKQANIPVVSESQFFHRYEIDEDIRQHLL